MRALFAKFVSAVLGAGLLVTANAALACNTGCAPPAPPVRPTPPSSSCGCETPPNNNGHHGGGSHSSSNSSSTSSASASAFSVSTAGSSSYGGGYGNWSQTPGTPENAGGLVVETSAAAMDMISEKRSVTRTVVIQANCIDDTGVPHPASQLNDEREINNSYSGEVYRCIAGTHMQATLADFNLCDDFGGGAAVLSDRETSSYSRSESHSSSSMSSGEAYGSGYGSDYAQGYARGASADHGYAHDGGYSSEQSYSSEGGYASGGAVMAGPCAPQAIACSAGGERRVAVERVAGGDHRAAGCLAKTDFSHFNFNGGQTMSCQKGEALWFEHGALTCKVQIPQRQCNERSLLRRFGAGIKILTMTRVETMQRQVSREASHSTATTMTFDGGVGGFVE